ncbi:MAG: putative transporter substrate-binding protein, partial [Glaciihabitans sp.]|nr:putative transporter substrate-binding protein [Glaciihabitans sp.]
MFSHKAAITVALGVAIIAATAGCSSGAGTTTSDPKAPLTVWVDADRAPQAEAYVKAHPNVKIKVDTVDAAQGSNTSKVALAKKAGSGVPDVIFLGSPDEISSLSANPINYPLDLSKVVPQKV